MKSTAYCVCALFIAVLSEGRPNVPEKHKRMVPILVDRGDMKGERKVENWAIDEYGSAMHPEFSIGESRSKAMKELLDVLGLKVPENLAEFAMREKAKKPPKYMVDLYNAIADHNGITRSPGLLDADTVRSIPNVDSRGSHFCKFDLSAVTDDEIILDAELHLFQSQRSLRKLNENLAQHTRHRPFAYPSTYIIKIYQMFLSGNSTIPLKRLISARRVHSRHSGWHIFPILNTVREWMTTNESNHGLMTEMLTVSGGIVENVLERESLQPILVLFTNNKKATSNETDLTLNKNTKSSNPLRRLKLHGLGRPDTERDQDIFEKLGERSKRSVGKQGSKEGGKKKQGQEGKTRRNRTRNRGSTEIRTHPENQRTDDNAEVFTVDQYRGYGENTENSEFVNFDYGKNTDVFDYFSDGSDKAKSEDSEKSSLANADTRFQRKPHSTFTAMGSTSKTLRNCRRYPLYVNFEEMGWSGWIIHPQGYNAYHCKGVCSFPLGQNLNPSNHATVQSIMHTLGLGNQPVAMPCCAPDKLYDINLLYFDENDYVVLRRYKNMVAASCACR